MLSNKKNLNAAIKTQHSQKKKKDLEWGYLMDSDRAENLKSPSLFKVLLLEEAGYPASEKTSIIWLEDCNNFTQGSCFTRGCLLSSRPTPVSPVATRPIIRVTGTKSDVGGNSWYAEELHGCCQIRERRELLVVTASSFNLPILPFGASLVAQMVKSLPAMQETQI